MNEKNAKVKRPYVLIPFLSAYSDIYRVLKCVFMKENEWSGGVRLWRAHWRRLKFPSSFFSGFSKTIFQMIYRMPFHRHRERAIYIPLNDDGDDYDDADDNRNENEGEMLCSLLLSIFQRTNDRPPASF